MSVIRDFYLDNGYAPSLGELQKILGINTKRGVVNHLNALEKKGFIIRTSEARGIKIVEEEEYEYLVGIPIFGYANAGTPLAVAEEDRMGVLHIEKKLLKGDSDVFALVTKGDSMNQKEINGTKIEDSSFVVVSKNAEIRDGDAVVAVLDNSATIKSFKREKDMIILYPESDNPAHTPIYLDKYSNGLINGKVIMALSNPSR